MMQREYMRLLYKKYGNDKRRIIKEYAIADLQGKVARYSNLSNISGDQYAKALYRDGVRKGWLFK